MRKICGSIWLLLDARHVGGVETHVATLCEALLNRNIDARVVLLDDHGDTAALRLFRCRNLPITVAGGAIALLRQIVTLKPSLIHTHGYKAGLVGRITSAANGIPCVSTFHAGERARFPVNIYQFLDELSSPLAKCVAVSSAIQRKVRNAVVIPNFVSVPPAIPYWPNHQVIGFVGRLSHEKAPDIFCQIARQFNSQARFRLYGEGPMGDALRREFADCVHFFGHVADMTTHWQEIGLLIIPSRAEGLPMAALEAMARGIPVIASRVGGLPELIEHGQSGWLFDSGSQHQASTLLERWLSINTIERNSMRSMARSRIITNYDITKGVDTLLSVYESCGKFGSSTTTVQSSAG